MPSQPACFERLDEILGALRSMTSTHLDRAATAGSATCAHSGCGGCTRTPPWGYFCLTGTNGSSETRGGYYGNCLTLLL